MWVELGDKKEIGLVSQCEKWVYICSIILVNFYVDFVLMTIVGILKWKHFGV